MANIGSRNFNTGADKHLSLAGEDYVRTLAVGSGWSKLRLGMLLALTPNDVNNITGAVLVWGLCAGRTNPFGAATTTNFLGIRFGGNAPPETLVYNAGGANPYYASGSRAPVKKVGGTITEQTGNGGDVHRIATNTGTVQRRSLHFMEITKGSPTFAVTAFCPPVGAAGFDFTPAHLLDGIEQAGTTINVAGNVFTFTTGNVTFNETPGALDSVNLSWNRAAFPLEVYAVAAHRFS